MENKIIRKTAAAVMAAATVAASCFTVAAASAAACAPESAVRENNASASTVAACGEALGRLPDWMVRRFAESGYRISIEPVSTDSEMSEANLVRSGYFSAAKKKIAITDAEGTAEDWIKLATLHEMGHWVDRSTSGFRYYASMGAEFAEIMDEEYDVYVSVFGKDCANMGDGPEEFFACAFFRYYTDGERLEAMCPRLYAYVEEQVGILYGSQGSGVQYIIQGLEPWYRKEEFA